MNRPIPRAITVAPVRKTVRVNAGAARAFDVFTAGFTRWWPRSHHISAVPMKEAIIEPRVGGRWYERGEDGSECEWGKVLVWEPPTRLVLAWQLSGEWAYDADLITELEVSFVAEGPDRTRVELEHRGMDAYGERAAEMRETFDGPNAWRGILEQFARAV